MLKFRWRKAFYTQLSINMIVSPLRIPGCLKIFPKVMVDERGDFIKTFVESEFQRNNLLTVFKEEYFSRSYKGVLRGMHFQIPPFEYVKIVSCLSGSVRDVLLDIRIGSPTYGDFEILELNGNEAISLYLPVGIAHGFISLSEVSVVSY
ncbi:dTDP-4-keto-6-deoxy-D-glucose epimerase, partial [bacterium]|nr:dTDP-4-keto-6-deoxy-D-glucose epimerase [bacterium]